MSVAILTPPRGPRISSGGQSPLPRRITYVDQLISLRCTRLADLDAPSEFFYPWEIISREKVDEGAQAPCNAKQSLVLRGPRAVSPRFFCRSTYPCLLRYARVDLGGAGEAFGRTQRERNKTAAQIISRFSRKEGGKILRGKGGRRRAAPCNNMQSMVLRGPRAVGAPRRRPEAQRAED